MTPAKIALALVGLACAAPLPASAAHWNVDMSKSRLGFAVSWSKQPFTANFKSWKANIDFDPVDLAHAKADVTIDIGSEVSAQDELDDAIKGAQGMAAQQFPAAHFVTTGFKSSGGNAYVTTGTLTLHGMTRPVTLPFTLTIAGNTAHMTGTAAVMRTDFGIGAPSTDPVAHEVTITVDLTATKN